MVTYWTTSSAQMAGSVSRVAKWASWTRRLLNKKPPATNRAGASPRTPRFCTAALVGPSTAVCVKLFPLPAHSREDTDDFRKVFGLSDPIDRQTQSFGRLGRQDTATVFRKLHRQLVVTEWTLRTAAVDQHLLDHPSSVLRRHGQDRRCLLREDGVAARVAGHRYSSHEPPPRRITDELIGEVIDAEPQATAPYQGRCHRVGTAELGLIGGLRRLLAVQRLPYRVEHRGSDSQLCGRDFVGLESLLAQRQRSVDPSVGIVVGRIGLEPEIGGLPDRCQTIRERVRIELSVDETVVKTVATLEGLRRPVHPVLREQRGLNRRLRGPSRLEPLDHSPRPVSLERAGGEANRDADGIGERLRIEAEELRGRCRSGERATDRCRVLPPYQKTGAAAGAVVTRSIQPQAELEPDDVGEDRLLPRGALPFAERQDERHNRAGGVQVGHRHVVEFERAREQSVHEGGLRHG